MNRFFVRSLFLAILAFWFVPSFSYSIKEGATLPDFTLQNMDGSETTLSSLRGNWVLLNFWATWCVPCKAEMPALGKAYEKYKDNGGAILGINYKQNAKTVAKYLSSNKVPFPILLDPKGKLSKKLNVFALPTTFFIGANGSLLGTHTGALTFDELDEWIADLAKKE